MHSKNNIMACRVCGLLQLDPPWGEDGKNPSFEICACCGVEFGYEDVLLKSVHAYRKRWIEDGAQWVDKKAKPNNWNMTDQLENIPEVFK